MLAFFLLNLYNMPYPLLEGSVWRTGWSEPARREVNMSVIPCIYIFLQIVLLFLLRKVFLMTVYQTVVIVT